MTTAGQPVKRRRKSRHFLAIGIGMVISAIIGAITLGPINAYGMFMLSVICTLGLSTPFWAGIFWVIGWVPILIFDRFIARPQSTTPVPEADAPDGEEADAPTDEAVAMAPNVEQPTTATVGSSGRAARALSMLQTPEGQALTRYIQRNIAANVDPQKVEQRLLQQGWTMTEVENAFAAVRAAGGSA